MGPLAAFALGAATPFALYRLTPHGAATMDLRREMVGIMLPAVAGGAIAFYGLWKGSPTAFAVGFGMVGASLVGRKLIEDSSKKGT